MFFFKRKTAYEMRISDWSSDVCSSDLDKMERAVDDQVRRVIGERNALLFRLARTGFAREDDVAEQDLAIIAVRQTFEKIVLHLRKGKDVGRLVLAPEVAVERMELGVVGEADRDLAQGRSVQHGNESCGERGWQYG